jgi:hypothetical protein
VISNTADDEELAFSLNPSDDIQGGHLKYVAIWILITQERKTILQLSFYINVSKLSKHQPVKFQNPDFPNCKISEKFVVLQTNLKLTGITHIG